MPSSAPVALNRLGQSLWLDNTTRDLLDSGTLRRYIDTLSVIAPDQGNIISTAGFGTITDPAGLASMLDHAPDSLGTGCSSVSPTT